MEGIVQDKESVSTIPHEAEAGSLHCSQGTRAARTQSSHRPEALGQSLTPLSPGLVAYVNTGIVVRLPRKPNKLERCRRASDD